MAAPPVPWGVPFPQPALSKNTFYDALGPLLGKGLHSSTFQLNLSRF
jgi:hypothetical protein